jgi:hypothetical protein
VLITTDEVIAQAPMEDNPGIRNILLAIQIAEDRFVKPVICKDLYYDFREKKNVVVTDINKTFLEALINEGNGSEPIVIKVGDIINAIELVDNEWYVQLWNEYLWKLTAECVFYIASPTNFSRYTAAGEMENNPKVISNEGQGSASVDVPKMKWKMDKILLERINPIITSMHEWLADNRGYFPFYNCQSFRGCSDQGTVSAQRRSGWIPGIYDGSRKLCSEND